MPQVLNPGRARTMDEFIAELRLLKAWAGNPSITEIMRRVHDVWQRAGRPRSEWPARSTIGNCFQPGRRRPNSDLLLAIVHVLVDGDAASLSLWRQALRAVLGEVEAANSVSVHNRLPGNVAPFLDRRHLLTHAEAVLHSRNAERTVVLEGMAGTGKTMLAIHIGRRLHNAGLITGPVLFVNLRGVACDSPPADPMAVLDAFLRLLGVSGDRIPRSLHGRTALYRQAVAAGNALIVLDNAADGEQVRPLLPNSRRCRTVITSRRKLTGLDDATRLQVPVFTPDDSLRLLRQVAGTERVDTDLSAARGIADQLGHLPLALSIIGTHMRDHPVWALTDYYGEPLTALALEGGVRTALKASEEALAEGARRLLRLLALHPRHELNALTAAALVGEAVDTTQRYLTELQDGHLLEEIAPGRYRFHVLVHSYAEERIFINEPASRIRQALNRLRIYHHRAPEELTTLSRRQQSLPYAQVCRHAVPGSIFCSGTRMPSQVVHTLSGISCGGRRS